VAGEGGDGGHDLTNVQCKAIGNWHNESPLYNKYMLIKMKKKPTKSTKANFFKNFSASVEKNRENLKNIGIDNALLNRTPIAQKLRARIDKWDNIKLKDSAQ
jgi:hypothetical protein